MTDKGKSRLVEERESSTRDAVETAIELSKSDRRLSWEEMVSRNPDRITRWKEEHATEEEHPGEEEAIVTKEDFEDGLRRARLKLRGKYQTRAMDGFPRPF